MPLKTSWKTEKDAIMTWSSTLKQCFISLDIFRNFKSEDEVLKSEDKVFKSEDKKCSSQKTKYEHFAICIQEIGWGGIVKLVFWGKMLSKSCQGKLKKMYVEISNSRTTNNISNINFIKNLNGYFLFI